MRLALEQSHEVAVDPAVYNFDSGIDVAPGEELEFSASGKWRDASHVCDADGWEGNLVFRAARVMNRLRNRNYFLLCLNLDQADETAVGLGAAPPRWRVPGDDATRTHRMYFFANDWPSMYRNNFALTPQEGGPLLVRIRRVA